MRTHPNKNKNKPFIQARIESLYSRVFKIISNLINFKFLYLKIESVSATATTFNILKIIK